MKTLKAFVCKMGRIPLPALVYGVVLVGWLAVCTVGLVADGIARENGSLSQQELSVGEFALLNIEKLPDGTLYSHTDDPQMILPNVDGEVRTFRFSADFSGEGYEMALYYTTDPTAEFDKDLRVWPVRQDDGSYLFTLPRKDIYRLRLDPVSVPGIDMDFHEIVLNEPEPAWAYYNPGWAGMFKLLFLPALAAAGIGWLIDMARHYWAAYKKRKGKPAT